MRPISGAISGTATANETAAVTITVLKKKKTFLKKSKYMVLRQSKLSLEIVIEQTS